MSGPFIFIATNRLKTGKLEAERQRVPGLADFIEANEPRLMAFNDYVNDEGTEVAVEQVHPDTDSFEFHMGWSVSAPLARTARRSTRRPAFTYTGRPRPRSWRCWRALRSREFSTP